MDLATFAAKMMAASIACEKHLGDSMEKACVVLENSAKDAIGTYKFGWAPLGPAAVAKHGDTPLLDTGELKASITHNSDRHEGYVGSDNKKATWHEFGTSKIPARPFLGGAVAHDGQKAADMIANGALKSITGP